MKNIFFLLISIVLSVHTAPRVYIAETYVIDGVVKEEVCHVLKKEDIEDN